MAQRAVSPPFSLSVSEGICALRQTQMRLCGVLLVTSAALTFGVVSALVKAAHLPSLVLQMCRAVLEWIFGVAAALTCQHAQHVADQRIPTSERDPICQSDRSRADLAQFLFGPPHLRGWIVFRAFLYWCFLASWWLALTSMPIGDATCICFCDPLWSAVFARLVLGEEIDWVFFPVAALDMLGLLLLCQPTFLFPSAHVVPDNGNYALGAFSAFCASTFGGMLPILTRKCKDCPWTAITHSQSLLSMVFFTPIAMYVWSRIDPNAGTAISDSIGTLIGVWPDSGSLHSLRETDHFGKWLLILAIAGAGYLAVAMQTQGYQMTEVSRACVMTVLEIPFSFVLQRVFFGQMVSPLGVVGAVCILSGTLLNLIQRMQKE